jgi:hypothetical protein
LASAFWRAVGTEEGFPRELETSFEKAHCVTVKRLGGLTLGSVQAWLAPLGIAVTATPDRALCGCLVARGEQAFAFVDADDPADVQRYTLAHELAHFLRDCWLPRQRMQRLLGPSGTGIFDGDRLATQDERLAAALEGVELVIQVQLWPRRSDGAPANAAIGDAETAADVLAFEILAPAAHLAQRGAGGWSETVLIDRLTNEYGLPRLEAARYAGQLRPRPAQPDDWLKELGTSA